jgi:hypothetical protein
MSGEDERCCGTGHCMINTDGQCWCGQQWDGEKMCMPKPKAKPNAKAEPAVKAAKDAETLITSAYIASGNKPA